LAQLAPPLLHRLGEQLNSEFLQGLDLSLYRWVMFGTGLLIVMLLRPEGLFPSKVRKAEFHERDEPVIEQETPERRPGGSAPAVQSSMSDRDES